LSNGQKKHYVIVCYRSPSGNIDVFMDSLSRLLEHIFNNKNKYYIVGDFNVHFEKDADDNNVFRLRNILQTFNLYDIVQKPTRNQAIIDNIFCSKENDYEVEITETFISDHNLILAYKSTYENEQSIPKMYCRCYNKNNINYFVDLLKSENWDELYNIDDIDNAFSVFFNIYLHHFLCIFPLKLKTLNNSRSSWVNNNVKKSSADLQDLFCIQKAFPEFNEYYEYRKKEHIALKNIVKRSHYDNIILNAPNKTRAAWSAISQITGKEKKLQNISLTIEGADTTSPQKVANEFNNFFVAAPKNVISNIVPSTGTNKSIPRVHHSFCALPFSEHELLSVLGQIKSKKSADPNGIPTYILKLSIPAIIKPLTYLVNLSFSQGRFPEILKMSAVSPIHKKENKQSVSNYRPISIMSCFSKIFEYAMFDRLASYLKKYHILTSNQHGFREGMSTITAVHTFMSNLSESLDRRETPAAVFCDLSRAFDCVDHGLLIDKLEKYGVRGIPADWFASYLTGRTQYVHVMHSNNNGVIAKYRSSILPVDIGVPQGSILGPVLFLLFVNDIVNSVDSFLTLYADDTAGIVSRQSLSDLCDSANILLFQLSEWFSHNRLYINPDKTHYTVFHTRQNKNNLNLDLKINDVTLKRVNCANFLGLQLDDTLNWRKHCLDLVSHINTICFQMRSLGGVVSVDVLLTYYFAQVQSRLSYGIAFWGCSPVFQDVFIAQKRVIRCIAGINRYESCRPQFQSFKILPLAGLYILHLLECIHKNKQNLQQFSDIHQHDTRNKSRIYPPLNTYCITQQSPHSMGIKFYNILPENIKSIGNVKVFKKTIKSLLIEKCIYSLSEFEELF